MKINRACTTWYNENKRDLAFRKHSDPYMIWVSEIMAQQTRIESMLPYFERWINRWPTIHDLANAQIEDVLKMWQGLGYYNRARKLHEGAKLIEEKYQGKMPNSIELLREIPGIGFYTAGAIGSIAFHLRAPAVDGNVLRVTTRLLKIEEDITKKSTVDRVYNIVYEWMEDCDPSDFTQGLMEIGALVCTPKNPGCLLCPFREMCMSYKDHTQNDYPVKKATKPPTEIQLFTYYIENEKDQILISDDWSDGLMIGLSRLPQFKDKPDILSEATFIEKRKHIFSHRIWYMTCYRIKVKDINIEHTKWVNHEELSNLSMVTAHYKWIKEMEKKI